MRALAALLAAALLAAPAGAVKPGPSAASDAQRFGKFFGAQPVRKTPLAGALHALSRFRKAEGRNWAVRFSPRTGLPRTLYGAKTRARPGAPEAVARAFLRENRDLLQVDDAELSLGRSAHQAGVHHLLFQQTRGGVPVLGAHVKVHMTESGEIVLYQSSYEPPSALSAVPSVPEASARGVVQTELPGASIGPGSLLYYPDPSDGTLHLAWRFEAGATRPPGRWVVLVDANAAKTLLRYNQLEFQACQTSGTVMGLVHRVDPVASGPSQVPSVMPMPNESVFVSSHKFVFHTDANGRYCSTTTPGKVFSGLVGEYVAVTNYQAAPAHYDNGGGQWFLAPSIISSPHPYANGQVSDVTITIPGFDPNSGCGAGGGCFAKVLPHFSQFAVGAITGLGGPGEGSDWTDDDFVKVESHLGTPLGVLSGARGASMGPAVNDDTYIIHLQANDAGTFYGYDVDVSSYLVLLNSPQVSANPNTTSSFTWVGGGSIPSPRTGADAPTNDGSLSEIMGFYHVNRMHDYFVSTVDGGLGANIQNRVPVMVRFGPGIQNAFYSPFADGIFFGDGGVLPGDPNDPFALDATVTHHEYTHYMVNTIFPIFNYGQNGAWSEGLADYFSASSFQLDPAIGAPGLPHIGQYVNWYYSGAGQGGMYSSLVNVDGQARDLDSEVTGNVRLFPTHWAGEIHADGLVFSQILWHLRKDDGNPRLFPFPGGQKTSNANACGSVGSCYKGDVVAFQSLFYFPESFEEYLQAALQVSNNASLGFTPTSDGCLATGDCSAVRQAFAYHGVQLTQAGSDAYEPNDGPATATDISTITSITATIFPLGDLDTYAVPLGQGHLHAVMTLPADPNVAAANLAYEINLLDMNDNPVALATPRFNVNPDPTGLCPAAATCDTTDSTVVLDYDVTNPGEYYMVVGAGDTGDGSNGITNSISPYTLTWSFSSAGIVSGSITGASFDNDVISFSVSVTSYTSQVYSFAYAQLRDQAGNVIPGTQTNGPGTPWLKTTGFITSSGGMIKGSVILTPGFNQRFPALGTVYLEIFGTSIQGKTVSLGTTGAINLTTNTTDFKAWNNIFNPKQGQKMTFRYDLSQAGHLTIKLYTTTGNLVKTVYDGPAPAGKGSIDWAGANDSNNTVASGVYLAHVEGPGVSKTEKVVVVK